MSIRAYRRSFANVAFLVLLGACNDLELVDALNDAPANASSGGQANVGPSQGGIDARGSSQGGSSAVATAGATTGGLSGAAIGGASATPATGSVSATLATGGASSPMSSTNIGGSGGTVSATGGTKPATAGGSATGGSSTLVTTGSAVTGGQPATGGNGSGGAPPTGGAPASGGTPSTGAVTGTGGRTPIGGAATTGGSAVVTGGAPATGGAPPTGGAVTTGGLGSGGSAATGGAATGGVSTSATFTGGASATGGSSQTAPVNTGGSTSSGSAATGGSTPCPSPITKPASLSAVEPTPADACARVSSVIKQGEGYYAFGYTNGEVWVMFTSTAVTFQRVDLWAQSGMHFALPRALVTALYAPQNNFDGALAVGYADPAGVGIMPWYAGRAGYAWNAGSISPTGTVLGISACPFHSYETHLELLVPWYTEESTSYSYVFSTGSSAINQHLQLANATYVTAIETITTSNGWRVVAGTGGGDIYITNLLTGTITWDATSQTLSKPVTWSRITDSRMPAKWVTRISANPAHPERIFATFGSFDTNALWFSDDFGQTWSNRHANLPTASNPDIAPPIIGASFNPFLDGAAYVVTPQTAYYTLDYGISGWSEW